MEDDTETPKVGAGDVEDGKLQEEKEKDAETAEGVETGEEGEKVEGAVGEAVEGGEGLEGAIEGEEGNETGEAEDVEGEHVEGEHVEGEEKATVEGEEIEGEGLEGEHVEGEHVGAEEKVAVEAEELEGEGLEGEQVEGEEIEEIVEVPEEIVEEEQAYVEEPPPDPAAPYGFSDSKEALKAPFELRQDQLAEVEQLWELYQNHTPAYSDLDGFITEKELIYMLKCLFLMTYTVEQLQELVEYCCRPPDPKGHIFYDQFLKMVTIRQRDFPIEEEIRFALHVLDPDRTGTMDRDYMREVLGKQGHKMPARQLDSLIKEVDMSNDGTIGIEDVVATMCIDLNKEDLQMLRAAVYPPEEGAGEFVGHHDTQSVDDDD